LTIKFIFILFFTGHYPKITQCISDIFLLLYNCIGNNIVFIDLHSGEIMKSLKSICLDLDEKILDYFSVLDEVHQKQHELNTLLKDGYFLLARARFSMGHKSVSALQFNDDDMEALIKVDVEQDDLESLPKFSLSSNDGAENKEDAQDSGLRQRHKDSPDSSGDRVEDISAAAEKATKKKDPINWFGVLVPGALRESQAKFKGAARVSCELASLKLQSDLLQMQCREALAHKDNVINGVETLS